MKWGQLPPQYTSAYLLSQECVYVAFEWANCVCVCSARVQKNGPHLRKLKCLISAVQFAPIQCISQVTPMTVCTQKLTYGRPYLESELADWRFCVGDSLESKYFSALPCRQTVSFESSLFKHNQIVCQNCCDYSKHNSAPVSRHICLMLPCDQYTH